MARPATTPQIIGGVDTHQDLHTAAVVSNDGPPERHRIWSSATSPPTISAAEAARLVHPGPPIGSGSRTCTYMPHLGRVPVPRAPVVLDAFSRRVVGWSMANHLRTQLVLDPRIEWEDATPSSMALWQRRPDGVIHHSDQGSQYTSLAFGKRCRDAGVRPSTGSVGDCYDNAMCESFFATLECELLERRRFRSHAEARMAVFEFIEGWYNPRRRHSAIGYQSPVNYERSQLPPARPNP